MALSVVEEEELAPLRDVLHLLPPITGEDVERMVAAPKPPREPLSKSTMDAMAAVASVLTVRLVLALAVIGAFSLAVLVVLHPAWQALVALGIFTSLLVPLCWLAQKRVA